MTAETPIISVVIVNWNAKAFLVDCVRSVATSASRLTVETIVVDNASTDGSLEILREALPEVTIVANPENVGLAKANNRGGRMARGRFIVFLNPDTILLDDALATMVACMKGHPALGAIGPVLEDERGGLSLDMGYRMPTVRTVTNSFLLLSRLSEKLFPGIVRTSRPAGFERCDWLCGACFMVRREVFERDEWKEEIFLHAEDVEYCARIREAGWDIAVTGDARVVHYAGRSFAQQKNLRFLAGQPSWIAVHLRERHGRFLAALGIGLMRLGMILRRTAHDVLFKLTGNPEQLYKANKLRQFLAFDDYGVLRRSFTAMTES